jgi:hypothetical protein
MLEISDERSSQETDQARLAGRRLARRFTSGVLERLLEDERLHIAAVSGTSAGAMNAVAPGDGMARGGPAEAGKCLEKFWSASSAAAQYTPICRSIFDIFMGNWSLDGILVASLPTLLVSPTAYVTELERRGTSRSRLPRATNRLVPVRKMP